MVDPCGRVKVRVMNNVKSLVRLSVRANARVRNMVRMRPCRTVGPYGQDVPLQDCKTYPQGLTHTRIRILPPHPTLALSLNPNPNCNPDPNPKLYLNPNPYLNPKPYLNLNPNPNTTRWLYGAAGHHDTPAPSPNIRLPLIPMVMGPTYACP